LGILFPKFLKLWDYLRVAALGSHECQSPRPVFREARFRGQAQAAQNQPKKVARNRETFATLDERLVSFKAFSGYFGLARNGLPTPSVCSCVVQPDLRKIASCGVRGFRK